MKPLHLITVGKLKEAEYLSLEKDYLKRFIDPKLQIHEAKSHEENLELEAKEVLKIINDLKKDNTSLTLIALTERGKIRNSTDFSTWLYGKISQGQTLCFIIGGASGHGQEVLNLVQEELSLSPLTFPHKMARLILVEQLYRAATIKSGHPYHK
jgi:23S rRNA (pseudouridine1915-N3)-methyltransferase